MQLINCINSGNYYSLSLIKKFLINNAGIIKIVAGIIISILVLLSILFVKKYIYRKEINKFNVKVETTKDAFKCVIYALVLTFLLSLLMGFRPLIVTSGSMRPSIEPGATVFIKKVEKFEDLNVGDVITFSRGGTINTTHQIVAIKEEGNFQKNEIVNYTFQGKNYSYVVPISGCNIITQGSANSNADEPIKFDFVKGKAYFNIWYLGSIILMLQQQYLSAVIIIGIAYFAYKNYLYTPHYNN